jgi:hypothetical protein
MTAQRSSNFGRNCVPITVELASCLNSALRRRGAHQRSGTHRCAPLYPRPTRRPSTRWSWFVALMLRDVAGHRVGTRRRTSGVVKDQSGAVVPGVRSPGHACQRVAPNACHRCGRALRVRVFSVRRLRRHCGAEWISSRHARRRVDSIRAAASRSISCFDRRKSVKQSPSPQQPGG